MKRNEIIYDLRTKLALSHKENLHFTVITNKKFVYVYISSKQKITKHCFSNINIFNIMKGHSKLCLFPKVKRQSW